ncbi:MAG: hypothetical protein OXT09_20760 [Myxococcales bacterium]|nr:hypothetical protein [Myxococcales bacterium]
MKRWTALLLLCCVGCGDDAEPDTEAEPESGDELASGRADADGGAADMESSGSDGQANSLAASTARAVEVYDRSADAVCTCLTQNGAHESEEDCLALMGSGETWQSCGTEVLEELDSPELRTTIACVIDRMEEQAACYERSMCEPEAMSACGGVPIECLMTDLDILLMLLERCPDLGLLSRT